MRNIVKLLFVLLLSAGTIQAQEQGPEEFSRAVNLYQQGKYSESQALFTGLLFGGSSSAAIHYNLGNCYYKQNRIGKAIQHYLIAQKLDPKDEDIQNNLKFAYLKTRDKIEPANEVFYARWFRSLIILLEEQQWAWAAILLLTVSALCFALFYISASSLKRQVFFFSSLTLLGTSLLCTWLGFREKSYLSTFDKAVVLTETISVKSEPNARATNLFMLHEGTVLSFIDSDNGWVRVRLQEGKEGWVEEKDLGLI